MAIATNYPQPYTGVGGGAGTSTFTGTTWYNHYAFDVYNNRYVAENNIILAYDPAAPATPKKKTFEEKMQKEVDDWLSIFN